MLCLLPGMPSPGVFSGLLPHPFYGSIRGQLFWEFGQGDPIGNGTSSQALPFSAHLLNHLLYAFGVSGIVLGQGFYFSFSFFNFHFQVILDLKRSCQVVQRITIVPSPSFSKCQHDSRNLSKSEMNQSVQPLLQTSLTFRQLSH